MAMLTFQRIIRKRQVFFLVILPILAIGIVQLTVAKPSISFAASFSSWDPGRIIDDSVFTQTASMNASQIQSFLNTKVSNCDTEGTAIATEYGSSLTHANYAASRGWSPPPYTCLKDYSENGITAAQIIYNAAQTYSINPEVLIVLLQKEEGLVTDTWPLATQYKTATGYGCPDTAVCDSQYYGLTNQINSAAKMFHAIMIASPTWYTPIPIGSYPVLYNPNSSCGSSVVNIQNRATQALYNYTPYQPDQAAIISGPSYGGGDSCSSFGNRNFYAYFQDWFGNTIGPDNYWSLSSLNIFSDSSHTQAARTNGNEIFLNPGQKAYVQVVAANNGRTTWQNTSTRLGTFQPTDYTSPFSDSSWLAPYRIGPSVQPTTAPYQNATFNFSITAPVNPSFYTERYNLVTEGVTWFNDANLRLYITVQTPDPTPVGPATTIAKGQVLRPGDELLSADRHTVLKFQNNGDLELFTNFRKTWATNTSNASQVTLQSDGNMVMYNASGSAIWSTSTYGSNASQVTLQSDGNMVMYNASGSAIWSTSTSLQDQTGLVSRKLPNGLTMFPGQSLTTPDRRYTLNLQADGNLVLYSTQKALWASNTYGKKVTSMTMQADGNLVLSDTSGNAIWSSGSAGKGPSSMTLQQDGNAVIYSDINGSAGWATNTANKM